MKIQTNAIKDGAFADEFGKFGPLNSSKMPVHSFGFEVIDYPQSTVAFALALIDYDAVVVSGAPFIHWLVSDFVHPTMAEGASHQGHLIEGVNSWYRRGSAPLAATGYGGMAPPDKTHVYTLYVFALKNKLNLASGFFLNEFRNALRGNVLAMAEIEGTYRAQ